MSRRDGSTWLRSAISSVESARLLVLIVVLIRLTLRRLWLALPVTVLMLSVPEMTEMGRQPLVLLFAPACGARLRWVVVRWGLLAFAVASRGSCSRRGQRSDGAGDFALVRNRRQLDACRRYRSGLVRFIRVARGTAAVWIDPEGLSHP